MPSLNSDRRDEAATVTQNRVERFLAAMMGEDQLSEGGKEVLQSLASSGRDLAEIGVEELKAILLEALQ
jgi:hypothetical protein